MTICYSCGKEYNEYFNVCPFCGAPLMPGDYSAEKAVSGAKKKKTKWMVLLIVLAVLLAGAAATVILLTVHGGSGGELSEQISLGEKYLSEENYDEAIKALNKAIEIDPNDPELYLKLAEAYEGKAYYDKAIATLTAGYKKTGDKRLQEALKDAKYGKYLSEGRQKQSAKDYEEAIARYQQAIAMKPGAVPPYLLTGECYVAQEDYDSAELILNQGYEQTKSQEIKDKLEELEELRKQGTVQNQIRQAFLEQVTELIDTYGIGKIYQEEHRTTLKGLCYVKLIDFDNDGTDELLCVVGKRNDSGVERYIEVYQYVQGKAVKIEETTMPTAGDGPQEYLRYYDEDGKKLLLTRMVAFNHGTTEFSQLKDGKFVVVKSSSHGTGERELNAIIEKCEEVKVARIKLDDGSEKAELEAILAETNETLSALGYELSSETENTGDSEELTAYRDGFINALIDQESMWLKDSYDGLPLVNYGFFDFDFDGKCEFFAKYGKPMDRVFKTIVYGWENGSITQSDPFTGGFNGLFVGYREKQKDYVVYSSDMHGTAMGSLTTYYFQIRKDQRNTQSYLVLGNSWNRNYADKTKTYKYFRFDDVLYRSDSDGKRIEITKDEYDLLKEELFGTDCHVSYQGFDYKGYSEMTNEQKQTVLEESYHAFTYEKQDG